MDADFEPEGWSALDDHGTHGEKGNAGCALTLCRTEHGLEKAISRTRNGLYTGGKQTPDGLHTGGTRT